MALEFLADPATVHRFGYVVVLLAAFLEAIPFVGLLVPGQLVVILAGALAGQGYLDARTVVVLAIAGGLAGQAVGYFAGRKVGRPLLDRFGPRFRITKVEVAKTEALFRQHGLWAVFLGNFSFLTRGLVNLMAGISRYPSRYFFPVTTAAVVVWAVAYTLLGIAAGAAWQRAERMVGNATLALVLVVVVVVLVLWLVRKLRARQGRKR